MNREIIYRAWHKKLSRYLDKEELTQLYIKPSGEPVWYSHNEFESTGSRLIIEQYIGRKDTYEVKIFEGDLVKVHRVICVVKWCDNEACFELLENNKEPGMGLIIDGYQEEYEVVGNIHQNKDLLGTSNETN